MKKKTSQLNGEDLPQRTSAPEICYQEPVYVSQFFSLMKTKTSLDVPLQLFGSLNVRAVVRIPLACPPVHER